MSEDTYLKAVRDHANGRSVCNCGEAYYDKEGRCAHGCSANLIITKYELVERLSRRPSREDVVRVLNEYTCMECEAMPEMAEDIADDIIALYEGYET